MRDMNPVLFLDLLLQMCIVNSIRFEDQLGGSFIDWFRFLPDRVSAGYSPTL